MSLNVEVSRADIREIESLLYGIKNGSKKVLTNSINKSIKTTQVQAVKIIGQELNLKAARIKSDFSQEKANFSKLKGALRATGDPVGLVNFQAKQTKKGVTAKVKKASSRSLIPGAYIGSGKSGGNHVFKRQYAGPKKAAMPNRNYGAMPDRFRLPTKRLTGPRIEDIYADPKVYDPVQEIAVEAFAKNVDRETVSLLRRYG